MEKAKEPNHINVDAVKKLIKTMPVHGSPTHIYLPLRWLDESLTSTAYMAGAPFWCPDEMAAIHGRI